MMAFSCYNSPFSEMFILFFVCVARFVGSSCWATHDTVYREDHSQLVYWEVDYTGRSLHNYASVP